MKPLGRMGRSAVAGEGKTGTCTSCWVCLAGPAECVVTGNLKHDPPAIRGIVRVMSPADFVAMFLKRHKA